MRTQRGAVGAGTVLAAAPHRRGSHRCRKVVLQPCMGARDSQQIHTPQERASPEAPSVLLKAAILNEAAPSSFLLTVELSNAPT